MIYKNDLILSASKKSWQVSSVHGTEADKKNLKIIEKVFKRDKYTCFFCNFKSERFQEIHHLDDNHSNYNEDNLVTVCPLCHQSFHLNTVSITKGGTIIWFPELCQQDLNHLCRSLFVAMDNRESQIGKNALNFFQLLEKRGNAAEKYFSDDKNGSSTHVKISDPGILGQALLIMDKENSDNYNKRSEFLKDFKILHNASRFPVQIKFWKKNQFANLDVDSWKNILPIEG